MKSSGAQAQRKPHSQDPEQPRDKKNFRDMFSKVKVFEFQPSIRGPDQMASPSQERDRALQDDDKDGHFLRTASSAKSPAGKFGIEETEDRLQDTPGPGQVGLQLEGNRTSQVLSGSQQFAGS